MSLRVKFLSVFALCAAFAMAAMAQDTAPPTKDGTQPPDGKGFGHRHGEGFRGGPRGPMMGELRGINLTDAQKQQIHTIMESNKPDPAAFQQIRPLMEAKRNGTITAEQQEQLKAFHQQEKTKMESVHQQIMAVLTPDQLAQIQKNKAERKERWEQRKQQGEQTKQAPPAKPTDN